MQETEICDSQPGEGCGEAVNRNTLIGPDVEVGKDFKEAVTNVFKEAMSKN